MSHEYASPADQLQQAIDQGDDVERLEVAIAASRGHPASDALRKAARKLAKQLKREQASALGGGGAGVNGVGGAGLAGSAPPGGFVAGDGSSFGAASGAGAASPGSGAGSGSGSFGGGAGGSVGAWEAGVGGGDGGGGEEFPSLGAVAVVGSVGSSRDGAHFGGQGQAGAGTPPAGGDEAAKKLLANMFFDTGRPPRTRPPCHYFYGGFCQHGAACK